MTCNPLLFVGGPKRKGMGTKRYMTVGHALKMNPETKRVRESVQPALIRLTTHIESALLCLGYSP